MVKIAALTLMLVMAVAVPVQWDTTLVEDYKGSGVKFTRPDGTPVYVNPRSVAYVRAPLSGEQGNSTIVFSSGHTQQLMETVEQVIQGIHEDMPGEEGP